MGGRAVSGERLGNSSGQHSSTCQQSNHHPTGRTTDSLQSQVPGGARGHVTSFARVPKSTLRQE